jgi:cysteine desulfuration protein SufE
VTAPDVDESGALPATLAGIAADFAELDPRDRLQLLLEFSTGLPDLPARYASHRCS